MSQRSAFLDVFDSPWSGCARPWLRGLIACAISPRAIHPWIAVEI
ncbi:hypothetical protein [Rhodanobacter ginsengiterrae]